MIAKLISALEDLESAQKTINSLWGNEFSNDVFVNQALSRMYPFGVSFDEIEITEWVEDVKSLIDQKYEFIIRTIDINAKEWFDKTYGNSYFSAIITLNYGLESMKKIPLHFQYGYGDHCVDMAKKELIERELIPKDISALWSYCEENGIPLRLSKEENCLKRDVTNYTKDVE